MRRRIGKRLLIRQSILRLMSTLPATSRFCHLLARSRLQLPSFHGETIYYLRDVSSFQKALNKQGTEYLLIGTCVAPFVLLPNSLKIQLTARWYVPLTRAPAGLLCSSLALRTKIDEIYQQPFSSINSYSREICRKVISLFEQGLPLLFERRGQE
ncbi:hypothetical protein SAMN05192553_11257 [Cyclobacterium xiamenense]|uniref:Uncharacterized protein n=1 Tax=Cyclobacterium xiamenense TaxID=1297121 RepID=A0A1H7BKM4_9BACT|nr:hypothetical protein SAMN05192553_11257 [Cyclobacterium xiamenense]